jgi:uncharacterized protein (DUF1697 family)
MERYAAFLRGINVGGVVLRMAELKAIMAGLGFGNVETYIQSGNLICESGGIDRRTMEERIKRGIRDEKDMDVEVFVKDAADIRRIAGTHPFESEENEGKLYVTIFGRRLDASDERKIAGIGSETDLFLPRDEVVYSRYGDGYGKSRYSNNYLETLLGVSGTTRNWRTMKKILGMIGG